jgi:hypothetical protein
MFLSRHFRVSTIAALALVCAAASQAEAAKNRPVRERLGGVVIMNPTENPIYFQMRLGTENEWTDYVVESNQNLQIAFELDRDGLVSTPYMRFDRVGGDDRLSWQEYELDFYEIEYEDDMTGFRYEFQYSDSGKLIDLYSIDGQ